MSKLQIFKNEKFGKLEIYLDEKGKVWFPATEIAEMLGYKNPRDAIANHCRKSGKLPVSEITTEGNRYSKTYINEGNVIRLIIKSHIKGAEEFESWIFDEVIPKIMKTGSYGVVEPINITVSQEIKLNNSRARLANACLKLANDRDISGGRRASLLNKAGSILLLNDSKDLLPIKTYYP